MTLSRRTFLAGTAAVAAAAVAAPYVHAQKKRRHAQVRARTPISRSSIRSGRRPTSRATTAT